MRTVVRRSLAGVLLLMLGYLLVLAFPQPLFAYEMERGGLTVHAATPIPDAMRDTLDRANARLARSPLFADTREAHIFICQDRALFALFARQNYRVGGIADWLIGEHVFLRESDMAADRLIGPSGRPVTADRPLSYFIAHEAMHIAIARRVGRTRYSQLPQWLDDGYADYVAKDIDYRQALRQMKEGARELDPQRSGLYLRYHLMVAYLLEKKGLAIDALLERPPDRKTVERDLLLLTDWPSS